MYTIELRGRPFYLHDNEDLSNAIARNGDYWEADILDWLAQNRSRQGTILDIGANIGNHTHYFGNYLKYDQIIGFEPDPTNFELLTHNTAYLKDTICWQIAVSNRSGYINLAKNGSNWGAHEVHENDELQLPVATTKLDNQYFYNVTLIKLDVEWHEPQVIEGAQDTIAMWSPSILIEDAGHTYRELLEPLGYRVVQSWDHHNTYLWETK